MAKLIDGKAIAAQYREKIKNEVEALSARGVQTGLAVVIVGDDSASKTYVANKKKACAAAGIRSFGYALPAETEQAELLELIATLNADSNVNGILVQLPLPKHIDEKTVINAIVPHKDVDAFHPVNVGKIMIGEYDFLPCTPAGIMVLLEESGIEIEGRECVVIGRSNIVGRPIANLLSQKGWDCTVTLCHSRTKNLAEVVRGGDIVIAALGKAEFVTADMIKPGAVVVDVGITRVPSDRTKSGWKLLGDVKFDEVAPKCSYITPVPGGVGPMTIISLMKNTLKAGRGEVYGK